MAGKSGKKRKKCFITEDDVCSLVQRYSAATVLALLQEVAQEKTAKIDWNALVEKTSTGITNAREYQMLWRHLAYHDSLDGVASGSQPLDDDSDLDCELEAYPAVTSEASADAAACVKVLMASGSLSDASGSTIEAPLMINIPSGQGSGSTSENSDRGTNICVSVTVPKQPLPAAPPSIENPEGPPGGNLPPRRRRKLWSEEEDKMLVDAVRRFGEGNWATIVKAIFKGDRTASQLSQRWSIIRKRPENINLGTGSQLSQAQLAARHAVSLALDMPMVDNLKSTSSINMAGTHSRTALANSYPAAAASSVGTQSNAQPQQDASSAGGQHPGPPGASKSRVTSKKPSTKTTLSPDSMVKAAAVAAGARIATPSDAASLLKAAQSKNAVHIMPGAGSLVKSSVASQLPSNVHFIRTGLAAKPLTTGSPAPTNACQTTTTQLEEGHSLKPATSIGRPNSEDVVLGLGASSQVANAASELDVRTAGDTVCSSLDNAVKGLDQQADVGSVCNESTPEVDRNQAPVSSLMETVQADQAAFSENSLKGKIDENQTPSLIGEVKEHTGEDQGSVSVSATIKQITEDELAFSSLEAKDAVHIKSSLASGDAIAHDQYLATSSSLASENDSKMVTSPPNNFTGNNSGCTESDPSNLEAETDVRRNPGNLEAKTDVRRDPSNLEDGSSKGGVK